MRRIVVTSALPYANGSIHLGHLVEYIQTDIWARNQKMNGNECVYICADDSHGTPIMLKAKELGISPEELIEKTYDEHIKDFKDFQIEFDNFHTTHSDENKEISQKIYQSLRDKGNIVSKEIEQFYDKEAKMFLPDRFIKGECPKCGAKDQYGDSCEECGATYSPTDVKNPISTVSNTTPVTKKTEHVFFQLSSYESFLKEWILEGHKKDWKPNVYGQCKSWIEEGLKPRAVTRDLDWGIPVPVTGGEGKVLYVWFDAPIGYISATKEWAAKTGKDWEPYWKDKDTTLLHFIGKDNIVFHCIIFPDMLKAEGSYILPQNVPANEFLNLEGQKLSTSKNWAVWLPDYLKDFPNQQDVLRYVLTATAPETKDNDFTWKDFQARNNTRLIKFP